MFSAGETDKFSYRPSRHNINTCTIYSYLYSVEINTQACNAWILHGVPESEYKKSQNANPDYPSLGKHDPESIFFCLKNNSSQLQLRERMKTVFSFAILISALAVINAAPQAPIPTEEDLAKDLDQYLRDITSSNTELAAKEGNDDDDGDDANELAVKQVVAQLMVAGMMQADENDMASTQFWGSLARNVFRFARSPLGRHVIRYGARKLARRG